MDIVLTHVHAGLLVIAGNCSVNHVRDKNRKENNFLKKSCVVSEIRYEFFFNFYSLFFDQLIFFFILKMNKHKRRTAKYIALTLGYYFVYD